MRAEKTKNCRGGEKAETGQAFANKLNNGEREEIVALHATFSYLQFFRKRFSLFLKKFLNSERKKKNRGKEPLFHFDDEMCSIH